MWRWTKAPAGQVARVPLSLRKGEATAIIDRDLDLLPAAARGVVRRLPFAPSPGLPTASNARQFSRDSTPMPLRQLTAAQQRRLHTAAVSASDAD